MPRPRRRAYGRRYSARSFATQETAREGLGLGTWGLGLGSEMAASIAIITTLAALLIMAGEAVLSSFNERQLRARGAIEPDGDVIDVMRWAYPGAFVLMGVEGALTGPAPANVLMGGLALFGL